eukprot:gene456-1793_t
MAHAEGPRERKRKKKVVGYEECPFFFTGEAFSIGCKLAGVDPKGSVTGRSSLLTQSGGMEMKTRAVRAGLGAEKLTKKEIREQEGATAGGGDDDEEPAALALSNKLKRNIISKEQRKAGGADKGTPKPRQDPQLPPEDSDASILGGAFHRQANSTVRQVDTTDDGIESAGVPLGKAKQKKRKRSEQHLAKKIPKATGPTVLED